MTGGSPSGGQSLRELAQRVGIDAERVEAAESDGTLMLLLVDELVAPSPARYTSEELVSRSGLGDDAVRFWRALGFPDPEPGEPVFGEEAVELLRVVDDAMRRELLDRETALQLARAIGSAMERVAQSQVDAIVTRLAAAGPGAADDRAVERAQVLLPLVPRILDYVWRRHLQVAARRRMLQAAPGEAGTRQACVGFADLVGFTALSQQVDDHELAVIVDRFEDTAYDVISRHGGRVVKTIGDEVMFEVDEAQAAVTIGLDLVDAYHDDEATSDVRVGIACGNVLSQQGDLYGPTVNLASRVVSIAFPASTVVSAEVAAALADDDRYVTKPMRPKNLKGIGRVRLHVVRRADDAAEGVAERARRRRRPAAGAAGRSNADG